MPVQHSKDQEPRHRRQGWWRDAVIYEIYVRSFSDSDGDGIGDLPGIRARLGHVAALGADGVWLTPFYPSPFVDRRSIPQGTDRVVGRSRQRLARQGSLREY